MIRRLPFVIMAFALLSMGPACSGTKGEAPASETNRIQADAANSGTGPGARIADNAASGETLPAGADWLDSFKFVRDAFRTEPSRYALKTAEGIEWGRSANPLEKALFLAGLLRDKGMDVEIARGILDAAAAKDLLGSIFPPAGGVHVGNDAIVSRPEDDPELIAAIARHFWVRMQDGGDWVDLDPSSPGIEPGRALADLEETYDPDDETLAGRISICVDYDGGSGEPQPILAWDGMMADVANGPLALVLAAEFAEPNAAEEPAGGVGGLFGSLGGSASGTKKKAAGGGTFYNAVLALDGEDLAVGRIDPGATPAGRIALRVKIENLDEVVSESVRVLWARETAEPLLFQRHAILVTGNRIPAWAWQERLDAVSDKDRLAEIRAGVEEVRRDLEAGQITRETLDKGAGLEAQAGPGLGHLINMIFASTSDDETEREGEALAVACWYAVPRILITSFVSGETASETLFDLRQDRVEAVALPGQARVMRQTFLYGRGIVASALEGRLLEIFSGRPALTTAALMRESARMEAPIRMFSELEKDAVTGLGLPDDVSGLVAAALDSGRIVIMPEEPVTWAGRKRWGWWDVDPRTMETVGVLDTGLHQAMVQRTILETKGPLDARMGSVVGAMTGAIDTYFLLSAMVLKHGELTREALLEAKACMKEIRAVMCPGFERKIGASVSLTVIDIEDCFKKEIEIFNAEAGVKVSMGWCDSFAKGFACVSTSILNHYLGEVD